MTDKRATCSPTTISDNRLAELRSDPELTRRVELQQKAAQQEYLRLKEWLSPLTYSEAALKAMSQSYMGPLEL